MDTSGLIFKFRCFDELIHPKANLIACRTRRLGKLNSVNLCILIFCSAIILSSPKASGQTTGAGNIQGTVTDVSGAAIPQAAVTLTEAATHVSLMTTTNSAGG